MSSRAPVRSPKPIRLPIQGRIQDPDWFVAGQKSEVVVAFVASWCHYCEAFLPAIRRAGIVASAAARYVPIFTADAPSLPTTLRRDVSDLCNRSYPSVLRLRVDPGGAISVVERFHGARTVMALLAFAL